MCGRSQPCVSGRWCCLACKYDVCSLCNQTLKCSTGHLLCWNNTAAHPYTTGTYSCNGCHKNGSCTNGRWFCNLCNYDLCVPCSVNAAKAAAPVKSYWPQPQAQILLPPPVVKNAQQEEMQKMLKMQQDQLKKQMEEFKKLQGEMMKHQQIVGAVGSSQVQNQQTAAAKTFEGNAGHASATEKVTEKSQVDEKLLCKICFNKEIKCLLRPCGHTLCDDCAGTLMICPFDRKPISEKIPMYFS